MRCRRLTEDAALIAHKHARAHTHAHTHALGADEDHRPLARKSDHSKNGAALGANARTDTHYGAPLGANARTDTHYGADTNSVGFRVYG